MTEQQVGVRTEVNATGGEDCLLELLEKVQTFGAGEYVDELTNRLVFEIEGRKVAAFVCSKCPITLDVSGTPEVALEKLQNLELCKVPDVRARMRLNTNRRES